MLRPDGVRVVIRQLIDDLGLASKIRAHFDEDGDGALRDPERERMQDFLLEWMLQTPRLRVAGKPLPLKLGAGATHGADVAASLPGGLHVNAILEAAHRFEPRSSLEYTDFGLVDGRQVALEVYLTGLGLLSCSSGRVTHTHGVGQSIRGVFLETGQAWNIVLVSEASPSTRLSAQSLFT
jgi:hypothetical protein